MKTPTILAAHREYANICVQCHAKVLPDNPQYEQLLQYHGKCGTFLAKEDTCEPISPVFSGLHDLLPYMKDRGWDWDTNVPRPDGSTSFRPWRVSRRITWPE